MIEVDPCRFPADHGEYGEYGDQVIRCVIPWCNSMT